MSSYFDESFVFINCKVKDDKDLISKLSNELYKKNIVKKEFEEQVLKRESIYPTGLECGTINVAIPHTDSEFVNEGRIAVAVLENPIKFKKMDNPDEEVEVSIVLMLAVSEQKAQIGLLQQIFALIQNQEQLKKIINSDDKFEVIKLIREYIN